MKEIKLTTSKKVSNMKTTERKYIQKLEELIAYYDLEYCPLASKSITFTLIERGKRKLKSELSSLKAEIEKEDEKPCGGIYTHGRKHKSQTR